MERELVENSALELLAKQFEVEIKSLIKELEEKRENLQEDKDDDEEITLNQRRLKRINNRLNRKLSTGSRGTITGRNSKSLDEHSSRTLYFHEKLEMKIEAESKRTKTRLGNLELGIGKKTESKNPRTEQGEQENQESDGAMGSQNCTGAHSIQNSSIFTQSLPPINNHLKAHGITPMC
ncbi:hypothetical protein BY996DRAFT_6558204 [Phakopsora pachyrhizi]|nr:hypothetical protein BY996DRAFT_6558204 [Phakopsora pachyrhizi]